MAGSMASPAVPVTDLVGRRCLLTLTQRYTSSVTVEEFRVLEVSPSGQFVRLMNTDGRKYWRAVGEARLVEELKDLKAGRPAG